MVFKKFSTVLAVAVAVVAAFSNGVDSVSASSLPRVHAGVHRTLRAQGTVNLIVTMKEGTEKTLSTVKEAAFSDRGEQIASMVDALEQSAKNSQNAVTSLLSQEAATSEPLFKSTTSFWVSNQVFIEEATFELVEKLSQVDSILEIREEVVIKLRKPVVSDAIASNFTTEAASTAAITAPTNPKWGVKKIQASDVWTTGNLGQDVNVGIIDTGVRSTHVALKDSFLGDFGWYDPEKKAAAPYDPDGHGTHTTGTVAGGNGVGVAPGAKWLHCKGCRTDDCTESDLLACAQFMTCPTNPAGTKKDCSKAPRVINNSWAGDQGDTFFNAAVKTWVAAGIIPVFANGNSGSKCSTAESPGDVSDVITVGATDSTDTLADFSSRGPSIGGLLKPDISAPGVRVYSASWVDDSSYRYESGTSMAAPHVTGAIALLLSAKPTLTYTQVKNLLYTTADRSGLGATGQTCGGTSDSKFPNNQYGNGRLNILTAVKK
ncbi:hypothetical protein FI667_g15056, partial [Globisporangium splendens]